MKKYFKVYCSFKVLIICLLLSLMTAGCSSSLNGENDTLDPKSWVVNQNIMVGPQDNPDWVKWKTDPCVIKVGSQWIMYFGMNNEGTKTQIGRATSSDGINWTVDNDNILVALGPDGAWDGVDIETPWVNYDPEREQNKRYQMWYSARGNSGNNHPSWVYQIGYAYSSDGINWIKYNDPSNDNNPSYVESDPVLKIPAFVSDGGDGFIPESIDYDAWTIGEPSVIFEDQQYKLYYIALGMKGNSSFEHRVMMATSQDGINWERKGVVFEGSHTGNEKMGIMCPAISKVGSEYWLFYSMVELDFSTDFAAIERGSVAISKSKDGINFEPGELLIDHGPEDSFYSSGLFAPTPVFSGDTLHLFFSSVVYIENVSFTPYIGKAIYQ